MASAFLGGFARGVGSSLAEQQSRKKDKDDWEWKQKKTAEMEEQFSKSRPVKTETYEENGQFYTQAYNAAGGAVGSPVPAGPAQIAAYKNGQTTRELALRAAEADIKKSEASTRRDDTATEFMDDDFALRKRATESDVARNQASIVTAMEQAKGMQAERREQEMMNEGLGMMNPLDRVGMGRGGALSGLRGGKGGGAGEDGTLDYKRVNDLINDVAATADDEGMADELREDVEAMVAAKKTATEIYQYILSRRRSVEPDVTDKMAAPINNWKASSRTQ